MAKNIGQYRLADLLLLGICAAARNAYTADMTYDEVFAFCGGTQTKMAHMLGVSQAAVSRWSRMPRIPTNQQFRIAALSGGALTVDPACLPASLQQPPALLPAGDSTGAV